MRLAANTFELALTLQRAFRASRCISIQSVRLAIVTENTFGVSVADKAERRCFGLNQWK